jgi:sulfide:quinone oxidoreductase
MTLPFVRNILASPLLKESRINHMGKMAFRWIYWNMLIKGKHIPFVSATMSEKGKNLEEVK